MVGRQRISLAFSLPPHPPPFMYSKADKQVLWFTSLVTVLVLNNKQFHLHVQRGHFIRNSYRVFGESSQEFYPGILSSDFVTEITDRIS